MDTNLMDFIGYLCKKFDGKFEINLFVPICDFVSYESFLDFSYEVKILSKIIKNNVRDIVAKYEKINENRDVSEYVIFDHSKKLYLRVISKKYGVIPESQLISWRDKYNLDLGFILNEISSKYKDDIFYCSIFYDVEKDDTYILCDGEKEYLMSQYLNFDMEFKKMFDEIDNISSNVEEQTLEHLDDF